MMQRTSRPLQRVLATAVACFAFNSLAGAGELPMLLSPVPAADFARIFKAALRDKGVSRERVVAVNLDAVKQVAGVVPGRVGVELFDGEVAPLDLSLFEQRGPTNYTLRGRIAGSQKSQAVLTVVDGKLAGSVTLVDEGVGRVRSFSVIPTLDDTYRLREIDAVGMPPDHPAGDLPRAPADWHAMATPGATQKGRDLLLKATPAIAADSGATVDLLIVYGASTAAVAGDGITAQAQQAVDIANVTYANSGIGMRLRLVQLAAVPFVESGDFYNDLQALTNGSGALAEVPVLRNTYGADLVSLFVEGMQYCGLSWIGPAAGYGFSVVNRACALTNLTLVHEIGHNFGARHEIYADPGTVPYAYGHGYSYPPGRWRTVMSTGLDCSAAGVGCSRIPFFSNPNLSYGLPAVLLGDAAIADNARVHNENAYTVANFRNSGAGGCAFVFSPTGVEVAAGGGTGTAVVTGTPGCAWNVASGAPWLSVTGATTNDGSGALTYSVGPNSGIARGANITIGNARFGVYQSDGCTYAVSAPASALPATGGAGTVVLSTGPGCPWTAVSSASWLTVARGSGIASATISYAATANTGAQRSASLSIAGKAVTVAQAAAQVPVPAKPLLSNTGLKFAAQKVGTTSVARTVTLKNGGGAPLSITGLTPDGSNPSDFARGGTCAVGVVLAPAATCSISYTFTPAAAASRSANLLIVTTAGSAGLALVGQGARR